MTEKKMLSIEDDDEEDVSTLLNLCVKSKMEKLVILIGN